MRAYVAHPEGKPRAGLLVFQEAFGVNAHIRDVTERFARRRLSLDFARAVSSHRARPGSRLHGFRRSDAAYASVDGRGSGGRHSSCLSVAQEWRGEDLPVGSTGYCMGGRTVDSGGAHGSAPVRRSPTMAAASRPSRMFPSLADRLKDLKRSDALFLGWVGRPHRYGCGAGRHQQAHRGQEGLRKRGVLKCRSRLLLRCPRQLQRGGREAGLGVDTGVFQACIWLRAETPNRVRGTVSARRSSQLDAERDEPHGKSDAESFLRSDGRDVGAGESAEYAADHQLGQNSQIVVARTQLRSRSRSSTGIIQRTDPFPPRARPRVGVSQSSASDPMAPAPAEENPTSGADRQGNHGKPAR